MILTPLLFVLGCAPSLAGDTPPEPQTKMQAQQAEVVEIQNSLGTLAALIAYTRDRDLAEKGYAPEGWEQPSIDVYEAELGERPSMLPYENFMQAVVAEECSAEDGARYAVWEKARLDAEAATKKAN
jgi:hypothetical protein